MDRVTTQKIIKKDIETQTHKKPRHSHPTRIFSNIQRSIYDNNIIKKACSRKKRQRKTHKQEIMDTATWKACKKLCKDKQQRHTEQIKTL